MEADETSREARKGIAYDEPHSKNESIVVIVGTTGVGKSKLAIELSKKLNGEVISADSMQIYKVRK